MREADSAACGKEDVKLGHLLHLGILAAERKRQGAPGVHNVEGNPYSTCLDACFPTGETNWKTIGRLNQRVRLSLRGRNNHGQIQTEKQIDGSISDGETESC